MGIMRTKNQGVLKDSTFDKPEINDGHYLELLDRTHVILSNVNDHLLEHPLTENDEELKRMFEQIIEALWDIYQTIGSKTINNDGQH
jgi:uncharacterized protein YfkK (UPF0435 family)